MNTTDPIVKLMNEHQLGLRELENMLQAGREMKTSGFDFAVYEKLREAVRFINEDIRQHNRSEEEALFPALEAKIGQNGPTAVMRSEHQQLWLALDKLQNELNHLLDHSGETQKLNSIAELATFIHDFLKQHIFKEDNILYPMVRDLLSADELDAVSQRMNHHGERVPPSV